MSAAALHLIQLARSLPVEDQRLISAALSQHPPGPGKPRRLRFEHRADGSRHNPEGLPNDDPAFRVLEQIEEERHRIPPRALPDFE